MILQYLSTYICHLVVFYNPNLIIIIPLTVAIRGSQFELTDPTKLPVPGPHGLLTGLRLGEGHRVTAITAAETQTGARHHATGAHHALHWQWCVDTGGQGGATIHSPVAVGIILPGLF